MGNKKTMKEVLKESNNNIETIMDEIKKVIKKNKIKIKKEDKYEIIIEGKTKSELVNLLISEIPNNKLKLLTQITESSGKVFIRLKYKK